MYNMYNREDEWVINNYPVPTKYARIFPSPKRSAVNTPLEQQTILQDLWIYTKLTQILWRPRPWLKRSIAELKGGLGVDWAQGVIGVMVRHTYAKSESDIVHHRFMFELEGSPDAPSSGKIPFSRYMERAGEVRRELGIDQVLILTDNPNLEKEFPAYPEFSFTLLHRPEVCDASLQGECYTQRKQDGFIPLSAIDILADCDAFISAYSSNLAAVIFQLARSRGKLLAEGSHPSVDVNWNRIV